MPEVGEEASSDRIQYRDPLDIRAEPLATKWDNFRDGLRGITQYSLLDNDLRFRLGFRFQADGTLVRPTDQLESGFGEMSDSADFRRLRLFAEGIYKTMYFRAEFDFGADPGIKDAYLEGRAGGLEIWGHLLGKFRYGYFQEPFSLEKNVSSFDTAFAEVSLPVETIAPGNNLGAMVYDASGNRRFTWAVGAFSWGRETTDNSSTSTLSLSGRFGYQPISRNRAANMLRLGVSFSSRTPSGDEERYKARPEARFAPVFADTGDIPSDRNSLWGLEAAARRGSAWAQAEWVRADVASPEADDPQFDGIAVQAGWFLTGFSRPWDSLRGVWARVRPERDYRGGNPFRRADGGEWEIAARYSKVDLTDGIVTGGEVRNWTAGVTWYPDSTSRLKLNWVYSDVEDQGRATVWILRYQYAIK